MSLLVAIIIVFVLKKYKKFAYRLVIYLMASTFLISISQVLGVLPLAQNNEEVRIKDGWGGMCAFIGYLEVVFTWMEHLLIAWITICLLMMVFQRPNRYSARYEVVGVVVWLGVPLVICWLPFTSSSYGHNGLSCSIKDINEDCNGTFISGPIYQFFMYYLPFTLLVLFNAISFTVVAVFLCKHILLSRETAATTTTYFSTQQWKKIKQTLPLLFYPIISITILALRMINWIAYTVAVFHSTSPKYPLWIMAIVVDSGRTVFPPMAFLIYPGTIRSIHNAITNRSKKNSKENTASHTAYIVRNEFSDEFSQEDGLIVKGTPPPNELLQLRGTYLAVSS